MGDCRLRIQISKRLLDGGGDDSSIFFTISNVWSTDTTLYDVLQQTVTAPNARTLLFLIKDQGATVWDCTLFPPCNITELCLHPDSARSTTLFAAGWFPSGSLQFLPADASSAISGTTEAYDDYQFNQCVAIAEESSAAKVKLSEVTSSSTAALLRPSQVLHAVANRFKDNDEKGYDQVAEEARRLRQQNKLMKSQAEKTRARKLDERIQKLAVGNNGKKPVSEQVRRMLIKTRATGRADLKAQDRIYLHCVLWDDHGDSNDSTTRDETYRYFSIQDTVGRAIASLSRPTTATTSQQADMEMLVSVGSAYRRLPVSLRFYEIIAQSFLSGTVDTVIVRWYSPEQGATTSIAEVDDEMCREADATTVPDRPTTDATESTQPEFLSTKADALNSTTPVASISATYTRIADALRALDKDDKTPKKSTTASAKVRQMQMKSKAAGDAKRVKMPDRFFLELVTVVDNNETCSIFAVAPVFLARSDPLNRLVRDCALKPPASGDWSWELLLLATSSDDCSIRRITASDDNKTSSWESAERNGDVQCFDRVVLRFFIA